MSIEKFEAQIATVDAARETADAAKVAAESAEASLGSSVGTAKDNIFHGLADIDGVIEGDAIVDYFEAAQRLGGRSVRDSAANAEEFARLVAPSADEDPVAAYFRKTDFDQGAVFVSHPYQYNNGSVAPARFTLQRNPSYSGSHDFAAEGTARGLQIFDGNSLLYLSGNYPGQQHYMPGNWRVAQRASVRVDFSKVELVTDPEQIREHDGQRLNRSIQPVFIGEAAEEALTELEGRRGRFSDAFNTEIIALSGLVRRALGQDPRGEFKGDIDNRSQDHHGEVTKLIKDYVSLLTRDEPSRKMYGAGMPVLFDRQALARLGVSEDQISGAILEGIAETGSILSDREVSDMERRIEGGKDRKIGETFNAALDRKLDELGRDFAIADIGGQLSGVVNVVEEGEGRRSIDTEALKALANRDPRLFSMLAAAWDLGEVAAGAIWKFAERSPRFKDLRSAE